MNTAARAPGARAATTETASGATREVLSFRIGAEEYGIDILSVQEIRCYEPPTRLANAPEFVKGVVNLRGVIVPIVDMRLRLGLQDIQYNDFTVTIVLNVHGRTVGMVVDSVSDVLTLEVQHIRPPPEFSGVLDANHITGLGTLGQGEAARMLILLDIEGVMQSPEMGLINLTLAD